MARTKKSKPGYKQRMLKKLLLQQNANNAPVQPNGSDQLSSSSTGDPSSKDQEIVPSSTVKLDLQPSSSAQNTGRGQADVSTYSVSQRVPRRRRGSVWHTCSRCMETFNKLKCLREHIKNKH